MPAEPRSVRLDLSGGGHGKLLSCIEGKHSDCAGRPPSMLTDEPGEQVCTCRCHRGAAMSPRERRVKEAVQSEPPELAERQ